MTVLFERTLTKQDFSTGYWSLGGGGVGATKTFTANGEIKAYGINKISNVDADYKPYITISKVEGKNISVYFQNNTGNQRGCTIQLSVWY